VDDFFYLDSEIIDYYSIYQNLRMKKSFLLLIMFSVVCFMTINSVKVYGQSNDIINRIMQEGTTNSNLTQLAHELIDKIGPRLVGTPQMQQANDWAVQRYTDWGINARNEAWGKWKSWERGITHMDMISPRMHTIECTQLAWSPATPKKGVTGAVVVLPDLADSLAYSEWMKTVKGKLVMISMPQPTGRPDDNWQEFGLKESIDKMKKQRTAFSDAWKKRIAKTGFTNKQLMHQLETAGAAAILTSNWSSGFGVDKIFSASTKKIPTLDVALEDYALLYRLAESGTQPIVTLRCTSQHADPIPVYNTLAEIKGVEKPGEYVMLSAHFDSWDGATGATDNGTGTLIMMEAMRILQKVYPNPKRTILVGHWGSEEQGLNGSRAFVEDHPEVVDHLQALFNQDNGTGRIVNISGQGFQHAGTFLSRWLSAVPDTIRNRIKTNFPGSPGGGGSDFASFVAVGAPGFSLGALSWSYFNYTWHTNRDTYDKIVFDDLQNNALLVAMLVYMAAEDPEYFPRDKAPISGNATDRNGQPIRSWPQPVKAIRLGPVE